MTAASDNSLWAVFGRVRDPRDAHGKQHPLPALLTLAATAMLCGCRSLYAISQWLRDRSDLAGELGFRRRKKDGRAKLPCTSELHYVLKALNAAALEKALTAWMLAQGAADLPERLLTIDGKTLRGSQGHQLPGVHLLAAFAQDRGGVLAQLQVGRRTNEHKAALRLLNLVPMNGTLITGDAAFAQRDLCRAIVEKGGTISSPSRTTSPN
jgi:hypothetical protein